MIQKGIQLYFYISLSFAPPSGFIGRGIQGSVHLHMRSGEKIYNGCLDGRFFVLWALSGKGFRISHTCLI